jgi:sec-independent protein translocase protein TatB
MFDIGWGELVLIGLVVLVVVGPEQIPQLMRTIGGYFGQLRRLGQEFKAQLSVMDIDPSYPEPLRDMPKRTQKLPPAEPDGDAPDLFSQAKTEHEPRE